jgi:hypothetical protein
MAEYDKGILYIAMADEYFEEAKISARSVRENMPDINVACITDRKRESDLFDEILVKEPNGGSDKVYLLSDSPFDETLYLDTDTLLSDDVSELFGLLEKFDIGAAQAPIRILEAEEGEPNQPYTDIPDAFPDLNTGVLVFRNNSKFSDLTKDWRKYYEKIMKKSDEVAWDQPSFRKAVYESGLRVSPLPTEYNSRLQYGGTVSQKVKIAHARLIETEGNGYSKNLDVKQELNRLNSKNGFRIFYYYKSRLRISKRRQNLYKVALNSLSERGIVGTVKIAIKKMKREKMRLNAF